MQSRWTGAHKTLLDKMRIFLFLIMIFILSALLIISNNEIKMYKHEDVVTFVDLYLDWAENIFLNIRNITGEAVNLRWLPDNSQ